MGLTRRQAFTRMKRTFVLASLLLATALARADIVVEQKMESAMLNGNVTMKVSVRNVTRNGFDVDVVRSSGTTDVDIAWIAVAA